MWVCLNNAFFSIVKDNFNKNNLLVRARDAESIPNVFGEMTVLVTPDRDYMYRVSLPRETVAQVIAENIANINYGNFKDSVKDKMLANTYSNVWYEMYKYQAAVNG